MDKRAIEESLLDRLIGPHLAKVLNAAGYGPGDCVYDLAAKKRLVRDVMEQWADANIRTIERSIIDTPRRRQGRAHSHAARVKVKMALGLSKTAALIAVEREAKADHERGFSRKSFYNRAGGRARR